METFTENQPADLASYRVIMVRSRIVLWYGVLPLNRLAFSGIEKYGPDKSS